MDITKAYMLKTFLILTAMCLEKCTVVYDKNVLSVPHMGNLNPNTYVSVSSRLLSG